jgi:hypothetical protein
MARGKRASIDYKPQFGGGIFRPRKEVEQELTQLEKQPEQAPSDMSSGNDLEDKNEPSNVRTNDRTDRRPNDGTTKVAPESPAERVRVRHSFDVYRDQLLSLTEIQAVLFSKTGKKPKLGDLVQDALDAYITSHDERTIERSNER